MAEDIIEEREAVLERDRQHQLPGLILFDPRAFQEANPELTLADNVLDDDELLSWARRCTAIRACFKEETNKLKAGDPQEQGRAASTRATKLGLRSRRGLKYSSKGKNVSGLTERELKQQERL